MSPFNIIYFTLKYFFFLFDFPNSNYFVLGYFSFTPQNSFHFRIFYLSSKSSLNAYRDAFNVALTKRMAAAYFFSLYTEILRILWMEIFGNLICNKYKRLHKFRDTIFEYFTVYKFITSQMSCKTFHHCDYIKGLFVKFSCYLYQ